MKVDLRNAVLAGGGAAIVSGVPSTVWTLLAGGDVLASSAAAGTMVVGTGASRWRQLVAGAAAHAGISLGWAAVLSVALPRRPPLAAGAAAGLAIAAVDLGVIGRRFPAIRALPPVPQVLDHVAYGMSVALCLSRLRCGSGPHRR